MNFFLSPKAAKFAKKFPVTDSMFSSSPDSAQIEKDIPRTPLPVNLTDSQRSEWCDAMRSVLNAYSNLNKEIGYIQGMNIITAALLTVLCPDVSRPSDVVPIVLVQLVNLMEGEGYQLADLYKNKMQRMIKMLKEFESHVRGEMPILWQFIHKNDVTSQEHCFQLLSCVFLCFWT